MDGIHWIRVWYLQYQSMGEISKRVAVVHLRSRYRFLLIVSYEIYLLHLNKCVLIDLFSVAFFVAEWECDYENYFHQFWIFIQKKSASVNRNYHCFDSLKCMKAVQLHISIRNAISLNWCLLTQNIKNAHEYGMHWIQTK